MCQYCEKTATKGERFTSYEPYFTGHYLAYDLETREYQVWSLDDRFYSAISYCPWCGRKLELPEEEPEFSAEDEIARLEGRINHTNALLRRLVDSTAKLTTHIYDEAARGQIYVELKDIKGKV